MSKCNDGGMTSRNASRQSVIVRVGNGKQQQQAINNINNSVHYVPDNQTPNMSLIRKYNVCKTVDEAVNRDRNDSGYISAMGVTDRQQWSTVLLTSPNNKLSEHCKTRSTNQMSCRSDREGDEMDVVNGHNKIQSESSPRKDRTGHTGHRYKPYNDNYSVPVSSTSPESSGRLTQNHQYSRPPISGENTTQPTGQFHPNTNHCWSSHQSEHDTFSLIDSDVDGDTSLHLAVAREDEASVNYITNSMLSRRFSLDVCNKRQQTSLHIAVITGNIGIIKTLLSSGACPRIPDRLGNTAVHLAVQCSSLKTVETVLEVPSAAKTLARRNYNGYTPLHLAVFRKDIKVISQLINKGSDCNCVDGTSGRTPLFHAVSNGMDEVVSTLINFGASVNLPNYAGVTPLVVATDKRLKNISRLLISKGATMSAKDEL